MSNPLLTIITINLNNANGLEQTIESVCNQSYQPLEYIVIDGGSVDESNAVISKHSKHIHHTVSEKDTGIYQAMNKGIAKANGEYLLFLNSGDKLVNKQALQTLIDNGKHADIIYGNIKMTDGLHAREVIFPAHLSFKFFYINSLPHSCTLIRKALFSKVGLYREDFKVASDWAFFILAVCKFNCSYHHVNVTVADFQLGGVSSTHSHIIDKERKAIMKECFPAFAHDYKIMLETEEALNAARKQLGYRVQRKIRLLFDGR